jgi:hydroxyethylthiazole kinase
VLPADRVVADLTKLRERAPLVHCMTNVVVTGFTANILLAIGASPAMVEAVEESGEFAAIAGGLLVNVGTLTAELAGSMRSAVAAARSAGTPWVLDPVAAGALRFRTDFATELLDYAPAIVRGNASEILSLAGADGTAGKGVDSTAGSDAAVDAARALATARQCVVAVSGVVDYVTDGAEVIAVPGGHPLMTKVTGVGCALGALMAAFRAVDDSALHAAAAASTALAAAGERAAARVSGPGSFAVALLDELYTLDAAALEQR